MLVLYWLPTAAAANLLVGAAHPYATVQAAVDVAGPGDSILIDAGSFAGPVVLSGHSDLEIIGAGSDPATGTVLTSTSTLFIVEVGASNNITLSGLVLDGESSVAGLVVDNSTLVALSDVMLADGASSIGGAGALVRSGSQVTFTGVTFEANQTPSGISGGGLHVEAASAAELVDSQFTGNSAGNDGGAIFAEGDLEVSGTHFIDNTADDSGAGVRCNDNICTITDSAFEGGSASRGGAAHLTRTSGSVLRTAFCNNAAETEPSRRGGALFLAGGAVTVRNSVFVDNHAGSGGGAIYQIDTTLGDLTHNTFVDNTTDAEGAAALFDGSGNMILTNNLVTGSASATGAAVHLVNGDVAANYTLFFANTQVDLFGLIDGDQVLGDPLLASSLGSCDALDVTPGAGSPAIDAGHPNSTDPDGSPADIGATGGQDAWVDADGDGVPAGEDCDDNNPLVQPGIDEVCDGLDNNCNDLIDDADPDLDPTSRLEWFIDADDDGFGSTMSVLACSQPTGTSDNDDDCDDSSAAVSPAADEVCNAIDDDCDGVTDDDCVDDDEVYNDDRTVDPSTLPEPSRPAGCGCTAPGAPPTVALALEALSAMARRARPKR